jgi:hypothetical protein
MCLNAVVIYNSRVCNNKWKNLLGVIAGGRIIVIITMNLNIRMVVILSIAKNLLQ